MHAHADLPDYGYDPSLDTGLSCQGPVGPIDIPPFAHVTKKFLPPVGQQGTTQDIGAPATCTAWASTYGLATFTAAKRTQTPPSTPSLIASPAQIYIQVRAQAHQATPPCKGSSFTPYFAILAASGTPTLQDAPYFNTCTELTTYYQTNHPAPSPRFHFPDRPSCVPTTELVYLKRLLATNRPIAYGTHLYKGWDAYHGDPPVYTGSGQPAVGMNGKLVSHCMLVIGYDDGRGAFHIQNSEGTAWGAKGYVWMAYETFQALAEGIGFYYAD